MDNNRVLVTGANGFVGRSVCSSMVVAGFTVRGAIRGLAKKDIERNNVEWVSVEDIGPTTDWRCPLKDVDVVIHLAARVHVLKETALDPLSEFRHINVAGTEHLAKMAADLGVRRFVYVSSIGVNGKKTNKQSNCFSELSPPSPYDPYTISKWEAEQALFRVAKETGLEVVILRPPLVYGPNAPGNFDRLIKLVYHGRPLPLSSVKNKRSFIYVGNLADAIMTCTQHPKAAGQTYLLSDGQDVPTLELIRRIAHALGRPARLFPCPALLLRMTGKLTGKSSTVDRLLNSLAIDSSKIRRELNWAPPFTMEQGLLETAKWFIKSKL